jgi:predicted nucleotidyltransferase component of viral defense system
MHWEILDKKRLAMLPKLDSLKNRFYLAGGTALALHLGHRDSVDFDFFCKEEFNNEQLASEINVAFDGFKIDFQLNQPNTILLKIDRVDMSFFKYNYDLIEPPVETEHLKLASIADIGCMKLAAIMQRYRLKDYIDLYAICKQTIPLQGLLRKAEIKFPNINSAAFLRALGYYEDIEMDEIIFKNNFYVDIKTIEEFFKDEIKKLFNI